jgi:hypothetical protein
MEEVITLVLDKYDLALLLNGGIKQFHEEIYDGAHELKITVELEEN